MDVMKDADKKVFFVSWSV